MKVLMLNGSPREKGNTYTALHEMEKVFIEEGVEVEIVTVGNYRTIPCTECKACKSTGRCVADDQTNEIAEKMKSADGIVLGSPIFFASANPALVMLLDKVFYSGAVDCSMKVGACVLAARRGGITAGFDELNKFLTYKFLAVAGGQYWNGIHGLEPGEAEQDLEGLQQMRTLALNMIFLMRSIALGKEKYGIPEREPRISTNFIR